MPKKETQRGLARLRREAGYRSARAAAAALGIPESTYGRYEADPARMPMPAAIAVADALGRTLDEVVGRPAPAPDPAGIQARFDALDAESRRLVDAAIDLLSRIGKGGGEHA